MDVRIYDTVKNKDVIETAINFGEGWINLHQNPYLNLDNIFVRVYSIGHPTSRGMTSFYGDQCRISIYTGSADGINAVLETIFHELWHVKQFTSKAMSIDPEEVGKDEAEAAVEAELMLLEFGKYLDNDIDK